MAKDKLLAEWFWTDRWMGSSGFLLPMEARGLYREMLTQAWRRGGSLPNDHETIRRATGCTTKEWKRSWHKVETFWVTSEDGETIYNETQQGVISDTIAAKNKKSERGKKAATKRWEEERRRKAGQCTSNAQASPKHDGKHTEKQCPPSPSPSFASPKQEPPKPPKGGRVPVEDLVGAWNRIAADYSLPTARPDPNPTNARNLAEFWSDAGKDPDRCESAMRAAAACYAELPNRPGLWSLVIRANRGKWLDSEPPPEKPQRAEVMQAGTDPALLARVIAKGRAEVDAQRKANG